jgi:hypothetical protein
MTGQVRDRDLRIGKLREHRRSGRVGACKHPHATGPADRRGDRGDLVVDPWCRGIGDAHDQKIAAGRLGPRFREPRPRGRRRHDRHRTFAIANGQRRKRHRMQAAVRRDDHMRCFAERLGERRPDPSGDPCKQAIDIDRRPRKGLAGTPQAPADPEVGLRDEILELAERRRQADHPHAIPSRDEGEQTPRRLEVFDEGFVGRERRAPSLRCRRRGRGSARCRGAGPLAQATLERRLGRDQLRADRIDRDAAGIVPRHRGEPRMQSL